MSILYGLQFGVRTGHSPDMALVNMNELVTRVIDENKYSMECLD